MLAECLSHLTDGSSVWIRLVLTEGEYFTEDYEDFLPGGGVYSVNYRGSYQLRVEDKEENLLFGYELDADFGEGPLNFSGQFNLSSFDYNWDGCPEITVGQWGSSSTSLLAVYTLEPDGTLRRSCPQLVPVAKPECFSAALPAEGDEIGRGFHGTLWDNAIGEERKVSYLWDSKTRQFLPTE